MEYKRLNEKIRAYEKVKQLALLEGDYEYAAECDISIGEIKGALLEMAELDGLDDPCEAFDY